MNRLFSAIFVMQILSEEIVRIERAGKGDFATKIRSSYEIKFYFYGRL